MRTVRWQGSCLDTEWQASASARSQPARRLDGLVAFGDQRCPDYELTWQLSANTSWATERLDIRLVGVTADRQRLNRTLLLERGSDGWTSRAWSSDTVALPAPGLSADRFSSETLDVVIDSCPLSHWAPIRRLGLAGPRLGTRRGGPTRPLASAFPVLRVRLPSLEVVLTRQRYVWVSDVGRNRVLNHSFAGAGPVPLTVDDQGVPLEFGGMTRQHDTAMVA